MMMEHILEEVTLDDLTYADMNGDGAIDILDVVILVNYILNQNGDE